MEWKNPFRQNFKKGIVMMNRLIKLNNILLFFGVFLLNSIYFPANLFAVKTNGNSVIYTDTERKPPTIRTEVIRVEKGNIYEKPEINSKIITEVYKGDQIGILYEQDEWFGVMLKDKRLGWIHKSVLIQDSEILSKTDDSSKYTLSQIEKPTAKEPNQQYQQLIVKVSMGRVREKPSLNAGVDFGLKKGDIVSLIDSSDDWYFIQDSFGRKGWAHNSLFDTQVGSEKISQESELMPTDSSQKILYDIQFVLNNQEERIVFKLSGFNPPNSFALEEDIPKVVCDFKNTELGKGVSKVIKVGGNLIDQIRIGVHKGKETKTRVVLDLKPHKSYEVEQLFFKKDNTYVLIFK